MRDLQATMKQIASRGFQLSDKINTCDGRPRARRSTLSRCMLDELTGLMR